MLTQHIRESLQVTPGPFPDFWVGSGDEATLVHLGGYTVFIKIVDARVTTHNLYVYQIVLVSIVKVCLLSPEMAIDIQTPCPVNDNVEYILSITTPMYCNGQLMNAFDTKPNPHKYTAFS